MFNTQADLVWFFITFLDGDVPELVDESYRRVRRLFCVFFSLIPLAHRRDIEWFGL